jgi:hypothetical protein
MTILLYIRIYSFIPFVLKSIFIVFNRQWLYIILFVLKFISNVFFLDLLVIWRYLKQHLKRHVPCFMGFMWTRITNFRARFLVPTIFLQ